MHSGYTIAIALPRHVAHLPEVELSAATLFAGFAPAAAVLGEHMPVDMLHRAQQEQRLWVALFADLPVGFAVVEMLNEDSPHLQEMDVHPAHGRRGVGTALLNAVCGWAGDRGFRTITLTTFRDVPWNYPFYRGYGFVEVCTAELSPELKAIVDDERSRGLEPSDRVVMSYDLRGLKRGS